MSHITESLHSSPKEEFMKLYLSKLGLDMNEVIIYYKLLELGSMTILNLSRVTGIERTKIYNITEKMLQEGIIEQQIDYKKKYIRPCNLTKLELIIKRRLEMYSFLENNQEIFKSNFETLFKQSGPANVIFYRGVDGIKQMLWNLLKAKKEVLSYSYRNFNEIIGYKFFNDWAVEFEKRELKNKEIRSSEFIRSMKAPWAKYRPFDRDIIRYIDDKHLNIQLAIDIYNDQISIYNWFKGDVFGMEIINKDLSQLQRQMFQHYWSLAKHRPDLHITKKNYKEKEKQLKLST